MICHTDTEQVVRALEILEIRTHRPEANGRPNVTTFGIKKCKRRRPPQCIRKRQADKIVCLDSACFSIQLQRLMRRTPGDIPQIIEGSLEVKLPTIWTDEKQSREEADRRERLEERRVEEKE